MPKKVYCCGECGDAHDSHWSAERCCMPTPTEAWICPICEDSHEEEDDAEKCCAATDPKGELVTCPNCFRDHEEVLFQTEVLVAGHCSVCNPAFTVEESFRIHDIVTEHALEHAARLNGW